MTGNTENTIVGGFVGGGSCGNLTIIKLEGTGYNHFRSEPRRTRQSLSILCSFSEIGPNPRGYGTFSLVRKSCSKVSSELRGVRVPCPSPRARALDILL